MNSMKSATAALVMALWAAGSANAQEVSLTGRVGDATEAVLPGVAVTALHLESGNTFVAVTDPTGEYRIGAMRPGVYNVTAELSGFATVTQEKVELLVGQRGLLNFELKVSGLEETVTVSGQTPLVDVSQSQLGGNIDTRQVQDLPLNGRNWMQLTMLAPGSRANAVDDSPLGNLSGSFQINLDGQEVTGSQTFVAFIGQPKLSRDAIGEFQMVSSRFDATQGRSLGIQVNAVTKSGTNRFSGTGSGYFRDDAFNAKDFIVDRVLEYSNRQGTVTFGGPIRKDMTHFFVYYEDEREPYSVTFTSPYPSFNIPDLHVTQSQELAGVRFDQQFSSQSRLVARGNYWHLDAPVDRARLPGGSNHPSNLQARRTLSKQAFASFTHTSGRSVHESRFGLNSMHSHFDNLVPNAPGVNLSGYTIGFPQNPIYEHQDTLQVRHDFTTVRGRHELKVGGEWMLPIYTLIWNSLVDGQLIANLGPVPANIESLFPVWNDPSTWNLAPLSPISRQWIQSFGFIDIHCADPGNGPGECSRAKPQYGLWIQDDWQATPNLTLNLGLRWDFALDGTVNDVELPPLRTKTSQEYDKFGPRLGFAYTPTTSKTTVIRGGFGRYYSGVADTFAHQTIKNLALPSPERLNDGRANFAADPWNVGGGGHVPTREEALQMRRDITGVAYGDTPYSYQSSIGLQHEITSTLGLQSDFVWSRSENEWIGRQVNLTFNPATGVNYPFTNISTRPYPEYGRLAMNGFDGYSNLYSLETGVTRRFRGGWQASATYTLSWYKNWDPVPILPGCTFPAAGPGGMSCSDGFDVAPDLGGEYGPGGSGNFGSADQRHRAVFNGIWQLPYGLQLSGLYFFGSGQRYTTSYGGDLRDSAGQSTRLRPNGTISPRNALTGDALHRVDLRLTERFRVIGPVTADAIVEVFNVFNHANYGGYVTAESNPNYGRPVQNLNVAYQPRMMQLGFRLAF